jgi:hypothetical protein
MLKGRSKPNLMDLKKNVCKDFVQRREGKKKNKKL